ncbi:hypothetical protein TYRP_006850 [Tyrophagus putrescentiae]|nr:hypothetical protein TYRP_006850 [Tyrophagus putrescentiae]
MSNVEWWSQMVSKRKQQKCGWNEIRELFKLRGGGEEQVADERCLLVVVVVLLSLVMVVVVQLSMRS